MLDNAQYSLAFGHVHRVELAGRTVYSRSGSRVIQGVCPDCTCHIHGRVTKAGARRNQQWQHGFAVVQYEASRN